MWYIQGAWVLRNTPLLLVSWLQTGLWLAGADGDSRVWPPARAEWAPGMRPVSVGDFPSHCQSCKHQLHITFQLRRNNSGPVRYLSDQRVREWDHGTERGVQDTATSLPQYPAFTTIHLLPQLPHHHHHHHPHPHHPQHPHTLRGVEHR